MSFSNFTMYAIMNNQYLRTVGFVLLLGTTLLVSPKSTQSSLGIDSSVNHIPVVQGTIEEHLTDRMLVGKDFRSKRVTKIAPYVYSCDNVMEEYVNSNPKIAEGAVAAYNVKKAPIRNEFGVKTRKYCSVSVAYLDKR